MGRPRAFSRALRRMLRVVLLGPLLDLRTQGAILRGYAEARGPLEDGEVLGLLGDLRDDLGAGRARADDADPLAAKVDAFARPLARVVPVALEATEAPEFRCLRDGQASGRHDAIPGREAFAAVRPDRPPVRFLVEVGNCNPHFELDVPQQIEPVRNVVDVTLDLGLGGVPLGPLPFLLELLRERVRVRQALDVAARARVAVPVPRPAHAVARLQDPRRQPELVAQTVELVDP